MANPLVEAHIEAERRLQRAASVTVQRAWADLGSWNEDDVARFLARAVPTVRAAQRNSVAITDAFIARYLGRSALGVPFEEIAAKTRNGVDLAEVYRRPFVTLWTDLKAGRQFDEGLKAAGARAAGSAAMDVQLAMRETANYVDQTDSSFNGYRRVANGGACAFCNEVDGAWVSYEDVMALHDHCNCGVEPNTDEELPPRQGDAENTAINDHGELGPMLGDPSHDFAAI